MNRSKQRKRPARRQAGRCVQDGPRTYNRPLKASNPYAITGGFPNKIRVRLKYTERVTIAAITNTQVWSGNSCFDPNVTGTGGQPYNFDDFALQYNRYRVLGSSITAHFYNINNTLPTSEFYCTCMPRHTTTSVVSSLAVLDDARAAPYAKWKFSSAVNGDQQDNVLRHKMSTSQMIGLTRQQVQGADQVQALVTASPSQPWYWHTSLVAADAASTINVYLVVDICYDVEFFDRNELTLDFKKNFVAPSVLLKHKQYERKIQQTTEVKETKSNSTTPSPLETPSRKYVMVAVDEPPLKLQRK